MTKITEALQFWRVRLAVPIGAPGGRPRPVDGLETLAVINYLHEDDAEEKRRQVEEAGGSAVVARTDVGVEEDVERLFPLAEEAFRPVA